MAKGCIYESVRIGQVVEFASPVGRWNILAVVVGKAIRRLDGVGRVPCLHVRLPRVVVVRLSGSLYAAEMGVWVAASMCDVRAGRTRPEGT